MNLPAFDLSVYEQNDDGTQVLVLTPLGTVAWHPATGVVWDAEYDQDAETFAALVERYRLTITDTTGDTNDANDR